MQKKRYWNKCISEHDTRDGDLQQLETALVPTCWEKKPERRAEAAPVPMPVPAPNPPVLGPAENDDIIVGQEGTEILTEDPAPYFSPADLHQLREDIAIVNGPTPIYPDRLGLYGRLEQCKSYWSDNLSHNRADDTFEVLWGVRVRRCMYRTGYQIIASRCPQVQVAGDLTAVPMNAWRGMIGAVLNPDCYARAYG